MGHRCRPFHEANQPVHVTQKVTRRIGNLRRWSVARVIGEAIRKASTAGGAAAERRRTFRVVHFSIQPDHLHLIVEATSKRALGRGLGGLASRMARQVNRQLRRCGALFKERYHGRALATPLEVRRAVAYVLTNAAKHADPIPDRATQVVDGIDPCSSARWFEGWRRPRHATTGRAGADLAAQQRLEASRPAAALRATGSGDLNGVRQPPGRGLMDMTGRGQR